MISECMSKWLKGYILNRPMRETEAIVTAAQSPTGAIVVSDLYREPETVLTDQDRVNKGLASLYPATDSSEHWIGFVHDDEEFGDAAIYACVIGKGWNFWLTVITEGDYDIEMRIFASESAAKTHLAATMCLQEAAAGKPIAWSLYRTTYSTNE